MKTFADVDNFFRQYNGTYAGVKYNGVYQCVAWAAVYSGWVQGIGYLPTPATNGARDIYEVFANPLPSGYDRIANTPTFVPRKGDIVVWGAMPNNPYGHIAVANGEGDTNWFNSYDQNWTGGEPVHLVRHNYNYVKGVLRPKNLTEVTQVAETAAQVEQRLLHGPGGVDEWINKYTALSNQHATVVNENASLKKQLADVTKQYQDLLAKPASSEDTELLDQTGSWLTKLLNRLFGGK